MADFQELKPNKIPFIYYRFIINAFWTIISFSAAFFFINLVIRLNILFLFFILTIILGIFLFSFHVQYKKERYVFYADRIVRKCGGIFSDREIELIVKNITHVKRTLPFIENKLFGTGSIFIESAGSGLSEISISAMDDTEKVYDLVTRLMKKNGFSLKKNKEIQKESPDILGVIFEVIAKFFAGIGGGIGFIMWILLEMEKDIFAMVQNNLIISGIIFSIILVLSLLWAILNFMDLKQREYDIYDDVIIYNEGFLNKNYAFMPIENLADSSLTQTFIDKIFGLYDVKISCQGSGQEIRFKNMREGKKLEENIDNLIHKTGSLISKRTKKETKKSSQEQGETAYQSSIKKDTKNTAEYRMNPAKSLLPLIIMGLFFIVVVILVKEGITFFGILVGFGLAAVVYIFKILFTRFLVKPESMESRFNFLTQKNVEFTNDKITGMIFIESWIDKIFKTCSIQFWSIGSSQDVVFKNIKKTDDLYAMMKSKLGLAEDEILYQNDSSFSMMEMFKATIFAQLGTLVILATSIIAYSITKQLLHLAPIALILFIYMIIVIYKIFYYKRSKIMFYKEYVYFQKGIFVQRYYHSLYDNIKDITTTRYPFSSHGNIKFNVAGEHVAQQGKNQSVVSNSFQINYVEDIRTKDELIDMIFFKRPNQKQIAELEHNPPESQKIKESKPALANTLVVLIGLSIIAFPLLPLLPITLPITILWVKMKTYYIEPYRVVARWGIVYKKQLSIVFNKIDHLDHGKQILNKIFKNGNIYVNTTGSSITELSIKNLPDYEEFYDSLKENYR